MSVKALYLSLEGRIGRKQYLLGILPFVLLSIVAQVMSQEYGDPTFTVIAFLISFWPGIALGVKRFHDRGRSGWFLLLQFVPLVNLWVMIELFFLKGTEGANDYGPDPLDDGTLPMSEETA